MNIPFVVETVLHDGLLKYKFKNSKIRSITTKPGKSKGAIFAYRSKKSMIGGRGVVLTSEEAIHENQDTFTHWTPNVYRYGTYADENRSYTKGHSENNLRQINTFFIDFDIHTEKETISASDILTTAIDLGFMPTLIIKSDKGYQAYFVLETPVYVTSKSEFKSVKAAKIISQNIREYFGKSLPVDLTCNHFGIARIPRTDNVEFFDPNYRYSFKEWQDWSFKQTDNKGFTRSSLTVLSGTEGKKQVDEPWFNLLLHETKFSGEKGLVGRNSVMFTLSLAYFSSGYSIETCEYNMFEFKKSEKEPMIFVLDEYPYLRENSKGLDSVLQSVIDHYKDTSNMKLIVCGSYVDTMKALLEKQNPLYRRIDLTINLKPMDYYESAMFYSGFSEEDKVRLYSVFGGIPYYNRLIDAKKVYGRISLN